MYKLALLGLSFLAAATTTASAAPATAQHRHERIRVVYSLPIWETKWIASPDTAHETAAWLRSFGCRVVVHPSRHGFDVSYTCPGRRVESFDRDSEAHRFERKLERFGFSVQVRH